MADAFDVGDNVDDMHFEVYSQYELTKLNFAPAYTIKKLRR